MESNFLEKYNHPPRRSISAPSSSLVIGAWFRAELEVQAQATLPLKIESCTNWWYQFRACTDHPQVVIRLAAWLGGIGLVLGVIGLGLGIISLWLAK